MKASLRGVGIKKLARRQRQLSGLRPGLRRGRWDFLATGRFEREGLLFLSATQMQPLVVGETHQPKRLVKHVGHGPHTEMLFPV